MKNLLRADLFFSRSTSLIPSRKSAIALVLSIAALVSFFMSESERPDTESATFFMLVANVGMLLLRVSKGEPPAILFAMASVIVTPSTAEAKP